MDKEQHQCCKRVHSPGGSFVGHPCPNTGKFEVEGNWYCGVHNPITVAAKQAARSAKSQAKWDAANKEYRQKKEAKIRLQLATKGLLAVCQQLREWEDEKPNSESLYDLLRDLRMSAYEFEQAHAKEDSK